MKNKYVILIIVTVLLFCLGSFIANATRTTISVPLGMILMLMPFACLTLFGEICLIKDIKSIIKTKKTKRNKKQKSSIILSTIGMSILLVFQILYCYSAFFDLINGPKEIIICDARIESKRTGGKYSHIKYFITGDTLAHEYKSILIRGDKDRENIARILEQDNNFKVYYFEKLNQIYTFEVYE